MLERLDLSRASATVTSEELLALSDRPRLAWAAFCVGLAVDLLSPMFQNRSHLKRTVEIAWSVVLKNKIDLDEVAEISRQINAWSAAGWGEEPVPVDEPDLAWVMREGYEFGTLAAGWYLTELIRGIGRPEDNCFKAAEHAATIYRCRQLWVQGLGHCQEVPGYTTRLEEIFLATSRAAFDVAINHTGEPDQQMFADIKLDMTVDPLPEKVINKSRRDFPPPKLEEQWLRETGQYLDSNP